MVPLTRCWAVWQHAVEHWRDYAMFAGLIVLIASLITGLVITAIKAAKAE